MEIKLSPAATVAVALPVLVVGVCIAAWLVDGFASDLRHRTEVHSGSR